MFPAAPTDSGEGELWTCLRCQVFSRVPGTTQLFGAWLSPDLPSLWDASQDLAPLWPRYYCWEAGEKRKILDTIALDVTLCQTPTMTSGAYTGHKRYTDLQGI